jgi:hypothetical protein
MAKDKPVKPPEAPTFDLPDVTLAGEVESVTAVVSVIAEPRNLTREMLAQELGEEEARRRIP